MRRSQTGTASTFGGARGATRRVLAPWGKPIPKPTRRVGRNANRGVSSTRKPTADPSLWSMSYPRNKPSAWPMENPQTRADLGGGGPTQAQADRNNAIVNHAFGRAGYEE